MVGQLGEAGVEAGPVIRSSAVPTRRCRRARRLAVSAS